MNAETPKTPTKSDFQSALYKVKTAINLCMCCEQACRNLDDTSGIHAVLFAADEELAALQEMLEAWIDGKAVAA